eukprot:11698914-Prorocentrum_lima.AAC.1
MLMDTFETETWAGGRLPPVFQEQLKIMKCTYSLPRGAVVNLTDLQVQTHYKWQAEVMLSNVV